MTHRFQPTSQTVVKSILSRPKSDNVMLIGFMGVGKTEVGRLCAREMGCEFCDTDSMVEDQAGRSIAEIFADSGEAEFRRLENHAITRACSRRRAVIATGGGAPLDPANRASLSAAGTIVELTASARTIARRIGDPSSRPLLADAADPVARIKSLMRKRRAAYSAIADFSVDVKAREPIEVVREVVDRATAAGSRVNEVLSSSFQLHVKVEQGAYPIWLGSGIIRGGGSILAEIVGEARACIVTHPHLKRRYAEPLANQIQRYGVNCTIVSVPQGETRKNLRTVERLYTAFVAAGLDRKGLIIAVGGGVIGDIAGFAAACYLRGVRCAQVPTTLLAQVDSSVGGKTGVDLPEGKNLVGAFHQPAVVLIDPEALNTLPPRELRSGLAEVIKYGIISDKPFFYQTRDELPALLNRDLGALKRAIMRSCEIKAAVVAEDEKEHGLRAVLNFGHTVGHALESATQYRRYRHGEAIAIGMVTACLIGEDLGITPAEVTHEVSECLVKCGLPVEFPSVIDTEVIQAAMMLDKKTESGRLRFVIAEGLGKVRIVEGVPPEVVDRAIQRQKPS